MSEVSILKIGVIVGSTRPGRKSIDVANWVAKDAPGFEIVDLAEWNLPFLDEPVPAAYGGYQHEHTKRWSQHIEQFDCFVFVTPEYNASIPAVLKNAIDFLGKEWANKSFAVVSYGGGGGARASSHLQQILANLTASFVGGLTLTLKSDFVNMKQFEPQDHKQQELENLRARLNEIAEE
jgi:NAD(P)H-dependent FMN reductase